MKQRQIKVCIPDELRDLLQSRADAAGHNLSEETRKLIWAGLATTTIAAVDEDWARVAALTYAAWGSGK